MRGILPFSVLAPLLCGPLVMTLQADGKNLIANPTFEDRNHPLAGYRIDFPHEEWYRKNKGYVRVVNNPKGSGKCVQIDLPPGVAGNEGGKIETEFLPVVPGATYRVEVDCLTWDFTAKLHAEAWVKDPRPHPKPDKFCVPAEGSRPALVQCYRAQIPDPGGRLKEWKTVSREFTVPMAAVVAGKKCAPAWLSVKAYTYAATMDAGKCYFRNFRLFLIKTPEGNSGGTVEKNGLNRQPEMPAPGRTPPGK